MRASSLSVANDTDFASVRCPFCEGPDTRVVSLFGGNAGESLMHCDPCNTYFHWIKWRGVLPPHPGQRKIP